MFDIILEQGLIHDGTGEEPFVADIGITGKKIVAVADLSEAAARDRVSAQGLCVAPGFVDLHTHSDFALLVDGSAQSQVHQGVTTEVIGQCGQSCAPVRCDHDIESTAIGFFKTDVELGWRSFGDYLERLSHIELGVNVAACIGHGTVHHSVLGDALRAPEDDEVAAMARVVDESFEQGAAGVTTGLEYWPGSLCSIEHIVPLCRIAAKHDRLYATHVRNRDIYYDHGFGEAIATARASGARLQISHIQPKFGAPEHAMAHTLEMIDLARRQGVDIGFDVVPHNWSTAQVSAILPKWAHKGGVNDQLDRLRDLDNREALKRNANPMWRLVTAGQWQRIRLLHANKNLHLVGATFDEIGRDRKQDPYDAALDLMLEEGEDLHQLTWTSENFSDDDIRLCMQQPECAVISDTIALSSEGVLEDQIGTISGYGWVARFLSKYVRDEGVLPMAEAIRRVTSLPAKQVGIGDRGMLRKGFFADICAFDLKHIASNCDIQNPRAYASGFAHVLVNGNFAVREGERKPVNAGKTIREFNRR